MADSSRDDALLAQVMREHPEYADLWPHVDSLSDAEIERDGSNPVLHVNADAIIENQLVEGDIPEVAETLEALTRRGVPRHDAIHALANEMLAEVYYVSRDNRAFNMPSYLRRLARLARGPVAAERKRGQPRGSTPSAKRDKGRPRPDPGPAGRPALPGDGAHASADRGQSVHLAAPPKGLPEG